MVVLYTLTGAAGGGAVGVGLHQLAPGGAGDVALLHAPLAVADAVEGFGGFGVGGEAGGEALAGEDDRFAVAQFFVALHQQEEGVLFGAAAAAAAFGKAQLLQGLAVEAAAVELHGLLVGLLLRVFRWSGGRLGAAVAGAAAGGGTGIEELGELLLALLQLADLAAQFGDLLLQLADLLVVGVELGFDALWGQGAAGRGWRCWGQGGAGGEAAEGGGDDQAHGVSSG